MNGKPIPFHTWAKVVKTLTRLGFDEELASRVVESKELAQKIVNMAQTKGHELTSDELDAKKIMGENFISISDVIIALNLDPHLDDMERLTKIPQIKDLESLKETHILMPYLKDSDREMFYDYRFEDISHISESCWMLVRKTPEVIGESCFDKISMLENDEKIPEASVIKYILCCLSKVLQIKLPKNSFVYTNSLEKDDRVYVNWPNDEKIPMARGIFMLHGEFMIIRIR